MDKGQKDVYIGKKTVSKKDVLTMRSPVEQPPQGNVPHTHKNTSDFFAYQCITLSSVDRALSSSSESEDDDMSFSLFSEKEHPQWKSLSLTPLGAVEDADEPVMLEEQSFFEIPRKVESDAGRSREQAESLLTDRREKVSTLKEKEPELRALLRSKQRVSLARRRSSSSIE